MTLKASGNVVNGKPPHKSKVDAEAVKLGPDEKVEKTWWFICLAGVSCLSLITRLYNLHQPASVWLVSLFSYILFFGIDYCVRTAVKTVKHTLTEADCRAIEAVNTVTFSGKNDFCSGKCG